MGWVDWVGSKLLVALNSAVLVFSVSSFPQNVFRNVSFTSMSLFVLWFPNVDAVEWVASIIHIDLGPRVLSKVQIQTTFPLPLLATDVAPKVFSSPWFRSCNSSLHVYQSISFHIWDSLPHCRKWTDDSLAGLPPATPSSESFFHIHHMAPPSAQFWCARQHPPWLWTFHNSGYRTLFHECLSCAPSTPTWEGTFLPQTAQGTRGSSWPFFMCTSNWSTGNLLSHLEQLIQCLASMWPSRPLLLKIFLQNGQLYVAFEPVTLASTALITLANLRRDFAKAFTPSGPVLTCFSEKLSHSNGFSWIWCCVNFVFQRLYHSPHAFLRTNVISVDD